MLTGVRAPPSSRARLGRASGRAALCPFLTISSRAVHRDLWSRWLVAMLTARFFHFHRERAIATCGRGDQVAMLSGSVFQFFIFFLIFHYSIRSAGNHKINIHLITFTPPQIVKIYFHIFHIYQKFLTRNPGCYMAGEIAAPAADDAMKRLREKRKGKKKAESSDQAASTPPPPPSSRNKTSQDVSSAGKKRRREDSTLGVDASVDLVFPQDASAYSNVGSILPLVERLLLPEDKSRLREMGLSQAADWGLGHLFQALQSHVHLKEELGVALKKVRDLKVSNQSLKADNDKLKASNVEAKKTALEASSRAVEATLELNRLKSSVDKLEAKLKAKEADYDSLYDKAEDNVLNAVIKTRADLMREYRDGRATEWKVDSWIADHEELSRYDEDEADDKPGEEPVPPPEGSTVVALAAQPTGEHHDLAP
ncbi:hypothetical protein ACOSQ3_002562 [Xanthoceras sorbifolium]